MSLIGKVPVTVPEKVQVKVEGRMVTVTGPKGTLVRALPRGVTISLKDNEVVVTRDTEGRMSRDAHGTARTLIANIITGVTEGFQRELDIRGVGYRAAVKGKGLEMSLGFSHPVFFPLPEGISAKVDQNTRLVLSGPDKDLLGSTAAKIRSIRPHEPYKGKGIRYIDEHVRQKVGKKSAGT